MGRQRRRESEAQNPASSRGATPDESTSPRGGGGRPRHGLPWSDQSPGRWQTERDSGEVVRSGHLPAAQIAWSERTLCIVPADTLFDFHPSSV